MPKPISTDFRRRVVDAYLAGEGGYKKLASRFSLSWNSVRRWVYLERTTNNVAPRPKKPFVSPKISKSQYPDLAQLVQEKPDRTLRELVSEWHHKYGVKMHISSMNRALSKAKISFKKNLQIGRA